VKLIERSTTRLPKPLRIALDLAVTVGIAIGLVLVFEAEVAKPYRIPSASMEPTLHCARPAAGCEARFSDRVVANRLAYRFGKPHRGDIVVFRAPAAVKSACGTSGTYVKRIIGLPGDVVSMRKGYVFIDGRPLAESYIQSDRRGDTTQKWPRVAPDHYFVMGDNRIDSCDSRTWGTVPRSDLIGPVILTYWPPTRLSVR
jgi:signal peptidase I